MDRALKQLKNKETHIIIGITDDFIAEIQRGNPKITFSLGGNFYDTNKKYDQKFWKTYYFTRYFC